MKIILRKIKRIIISNHLLKIIFKPLLLIDEAYHTSLLYLKKEDRIGWQKRINTILSSPDLIHIQKVANAGKIKNGYLVMHNGIKIIPTSYYGYPIRRMLKLTKGIHEPQEEKVFNEVLKVLPENSVMVELGSYWAFYSMWFHQKVKFPKCFLIEPTFDGLESGKNNFYANKMKGDFKRAYIGAKEGIAEDGVAIISVDSFMMEKNLTFIDILHSDIQGAELDMLYGASKSLNENRIGYIFISTHSQELHYSCIDFINQLNYKIIASADIDETFSLDGLIVAKSSLYKGPDVIEISNKKKNK